MADFIPTANRGRNEPIWNWCQRLLFGDGIFISFSRQDGFEYAPALAVRLKGYKCFLDQLGTEPDQALPEAAKLKVGFGRQDGI